MAVPGTTSAHEGVPGAHEGVPGLGRAPGIAAACAALYAVVEIAWAVTGTTVPFAAHTPCPPAVQLALAALAVAAGLACRATGRPLARPGRTAVRGVLVLATPVLATGAVGLPAHFVTLAAGSGPESVTGLAHVLPYAARTRPACASTAATTAATTAASAKAQPSAVPWGRMTR
ncbi:hypothetical protein [Streptomyces yangpuensis]|uniref:hypothetical protein n=1 Tax=Streptomyces yangpuensis TaxID=1648182 RepID=UPI003690185B